MAEPGATTVVSGGPELSPARKRIVLGTCCTAVLMAQLDSTALNVALPSIGRDLNTSISGTQWTVDAYTVVLASLMLFMGALGDRIGKRRVFLIGLVVFACGSLLCSLAPSFGWLVGFRIFQAIGGSMLNPSAIAIISGVFTGPGQRARALGFWSGTTGISTAAGPVVGGFLVDSAGWQSIFWINVPIAVLAFLATLRFIPGARTRVPRRLDPVGQLLATGFLGLLIFAIIEGPHRGWLSAVTIGCFLGCLACLAGLLRYEPRHDQPLIDVRDFRSPPFTGAVLVAISAYVAVGGFLFLNTYYLQDIRKLDPLHAGLELLPMAAAIAVAGPLSGRLTALRGARFALTLGAAITTLAALALTFTFETDHPVVRLTAYGCLGAGVGMMNTPITDTAISGLPRSRAGVASSVATTSRQFGQALGVAVIGSIIAGTPGALESEDAFRGPATSSWIVMTGFAVLALIVVRTMIGRPGPRDRSEVSSLAADAK
ncbi:MFS transporter [Nocardia sp. NPDC127526]|uniref:MFS transporter n=1 Tax=Nocardia sp. NPDC127526 TaxID=3345393 RepID=UPI00362BF7EB